MAPAWHSSRAATVLWDVMQEEAPGFVPGQPGLPGWPRSPLMPCLLAQPRPSQVRAQERATATWEVHQQSWAPRGKRKREAKVWRPGGSAQ